METENPTEPLLGIKEATTHLLWPSNAEASAVSGVDELSLETQLELYKDLAAWREAQLRTMTSRLDRKKNEVARWQKKYEAAAGLKERADRRNALNRARANKFEDLYWNLKRNGTEESRRGLLRAIWSLLY